MGSHRHGAALGAVAVIVGAAFGVWVLALDRGAVFGPLGWTYIAWAAFAVVCGGSLLWVWLAIRPLWASDRPRVPRGMLLLDGYGPLHRPEQRPESPWWYVCRLAPQREFSPAVFRVKVTEPAQVIRGTVTQYDKIFEVMQAYNPGEPISMEEALRSAHPDAVARQREPQGATLDFRSTPITPRDGLVIVAESTSRDLRITSVKEVKRRR